MILTIYYIILGYFALGAVGFSVINRKKLPEIARQNRIKYFGYFVIINVMFLSIAIKPVVFKYLTILIVLVSGFELIHLFVKSGYKNKYVFLLYLTAIIVFGIGLISFSSFNRQTIVFSFLILSIFDSFSQIAGQLFGRRKILPTISPNKTLEGLIGGAIIALISVAFLRGLYPESLFKVLTMTAGIIVFAFLGDLAASYYKRKFGVKDFSNLIPGHGGFLDRFDSLIAAGAWVALFQTFNI